MSPNRTDVVKVPLPPNIGVGLIVGRGGCNTRWLHIHSGGAHITVNEMEVVIRAKDAQVRTRAVQLVRKQLEAMEKFGTHDALSPRRLDYVLLESGFGSDPRVRFAPRNDEMAAAVVRKDKLFELVPVPRRCGGAGGATEEPDAAVEEEEQSPLLAEVECWVLVPGAAKHGGVGIGIGIGIGGAAAAVAALQLKASSSDLEPSPLPDHVGPRDQNEDRVLMPDRSPSPSLTPSLSSPLEPRSPAAATLRFHATPHSGPQPLTSAARTLAAAARSAAAAATGQESAFEALKTRFHLGKHLFRNLGARGTREELTVPELEGGGPGRGEFQSVFSNFVPTAAVPRVTSWLTDTLGFSLVDTKTSATLHVINQELNVHYSIGLTMERGDDSTASLRKVKAGGSKYHSVALLAAPNQMDLRLRLVAQSAHHEQAGQAYGTDAHTTARRVAAAVRTEGFDGFTRSKRGLPRNRHLEYARRKTKFVYEGCLPQAGCGGGCGPQRLRVSVTQVQDDKGTHYEISGCLPEVDASLRQMLTQQHQQHCPAAEASGEFVPEWRRGRSSGGGAAAAVVAGGHRRVYHSAGSSPARVSAALVLKAAPASPPAPTSPLDDADAQWASAALAVLSDFITQLNHHLEK